MVYSGSVSGHTQSNHQAQGINQTHRICSESCPLMIMWFCDRGPKLLRLHERSNRRDSRVCGAVDGWTRCFGGHQLAQPAFEELGPRALDPEGAAQSAVIVDRRANLQPVYPRKRTSATAAVSFGPAPDIRCPFSSQRSARRTLQRPLLCIAPLARASLRLPHGITDMIVCPSAQPSQWLVTFRSIALFARMPTSWCGHIGRRCGIVG
jgi:hypothetical protein